MLNMSDADLPLGCSDVSAGCQAAWVAVFERRTQAAGNGSAYGGGKTSESRHAVTRGCL